MDNLSRIFWFSGTGNSLLAAKSLSAGLGGVRLTQITNETPSGAVGGKGEKVGFVFPSYYGNMPRAVRAFVEKLEIRADSYIFCVVTMGGLGQGSVGALRKALKKKGLRLDYGKGVLMPANYVMKYDPADPDKSSKSLDRADGRFKEIIAEINAGSQIVKTLPVTANNLYRNVESLDAGFVVGGECTSCGLCERVCPVKNIELANGKPVWGRRCEHCVACISWCPEKCINFGDKTQARRRYRNPLIDVEELARGE